jgi:hypothetical protein
MPKHKAKLHAERDDAALGVVDSDHLYTRREFSKLERISLSTYFQLLKKGLAPYERHIRGTKIFHISEASRREWRARMHRLSQEETSRLIDERRREQARKAGKIAAQSPAHVSKVGKARKDARLDGAV